MLRRRAKKLVVVLVAGLFAGWLPKGKRTPGYKPGCEQPGTFRLLPASGEAMYSLLVEATSDRGKVVIATKPRGRSPVQQDESRARTGSQRSTAGPFCRAGESLGPAALNESMATDLAQRGTWR